MDDWLNNLRAAGLLREHTPEQWEAYIRKYFGPDSPLPKAFSRPRHDYKDLRWRDPHRLEYRPLPEDMDPDV